MHCTSLLENIIRNSARHGSTEDYKSPVALEVSLCEQDQNSDSDLLKLQIVDNRSPVSISHQMTLTLGNPVEAADGWVTVSYKVPTSREENSLRDTEGKSAEQFSIRAGGDGNGASAVNSEALEPVAAAVTGNSLVLTFNKVLDAGSVPDKALFDVTADGSHVSVSEVAIPRLDKGINAILNEPILTLDGEPKAENWGIREMQICAHYLRGFSLFDLETAPDNNRKVLQADCHGGRLKYIIYLQRAKRLAVVVKDESTQKDQDKSEDIGGMKSAAGIKYGQLGILRIETTGAPNWMEIGRDEIGGYDFLVVEDGIALPHCPRGRAEARMPVRAFNMSRFRIEKLLQDAKCNSLWMEKLHKRWAKKVRDDHPEWKGKYLLGVAISRGDALEPLPSSEWPKDANCRKDGMILASSPEKTEDGYNEDTKPLATGAKGWLEKLEEGNALAAAWVDHGKEDDFSRDSAGLGLSVVRALSDGRLWISAETARGGHPHARDLSALFNDHNGSALFDDNTGRKWELLAAAIPRVTVLDERVQAAGEQNSPVSGICLRDLWRYMGVWTPALPKEGSDDQDDCDLDVPNFGRIQAFLGIREEHLDRCPIDILVVHLTILERLANDRNKEALGRTLKCLCDDTWASEAEVVIVTGRGVPAVARSAATDHSLLGLRYLPISALLENLVSVPSKLSLMRTLWSAGVPN